MPLMLRPILSTMPLGGRDNPADGVAYAVGKLGCLLDARSRLRAHVHRDLAT